MIELRVLLFVGTNLLTQYLHTTSVSNQLSTKFCTYEHNSAYDLYRSAVLVSNCSPGFPQQYGTCLVPISRSERKLEPPVSEGFFSNHLSTNDTTYRPPVARLYTNYRPLVFFPDCAIRSKLCPLFTIILHCVYVMHSQTCTVNSI